MNISMATVISNSSLFGHKIINNNKFFCVKLDLLSMKLINYWNLLKTSVQCDRWQPIYGLQITCTLLTLKMQNIIIYGIFFVSILFCLFVRMDPAGKLDTLLHYWKCTSKKHVHHDYFYYGCRYYVCIDDWYLNRNFVETMFNAYEHLLITWMNVDHGIWTRKQQFKQNIKKGFTRKHHQIQCWHCIWDHVI